jgi:acyl-CoA reductase-like NAD-dependent aldehyde dehydrogenase
MQFFDPRPLSRGVCELAMLIDGARVTGHGPQTFARKSPAHGDVVTRYAAAGPDDIQGALSAARRAFDVGPWPRLSARERSEVLTTIANIIVQNGDELALLDCLEAGKPLSQAKSEIADSAEFFRYAASLARVLHGESYAGLREDIFATTIREPMGVIAMITPWNFPFLIACQKIPFALAAGCTMVVKPSEMTSASLLRFCEFVQDVLPPGVLNVLVGDGPTAGEPLVRDSRVDMVSFTGSTRAGRAVAAAAADGVKKVALELGGKNPQIICADADLDAAAAAVVHGVFFNAGQCCQASGRIIVEREIVAAFTDRVVALTKDVRVGDPLDPAVQMGAIVSAQQMGRIAELVGTVASEGGHIATGGRAVQRTSGMFYEPTVITDVAPAARLSQEEVFGPVLSITPFDHFEDAISLANQTRYGLGSGLWTNDNSRVMRGLKAIRAGTVWINCFMEVFPEMPFGGFKDSGIGRECGKLSVEDYTEIKSVVMSKVRTKNWN